MKSIQCVMKRPFIYCWKGMGDKDKSRYEPVHL